MNLGKEITTSLSLASISNVTEVKNLVSEPGDLKAGSNKNVACNASYGALGSQHSQESSSHDRASKHNNTPSLVSSPGVSNVTTETSDQHGAANSPLSVCRVWVDKSSVELAPLQELVVHWRLPLLVSLTGHWLGLYRAGE